MSAFTDLLENINARRLYLVTVKPYAFIRGTVTAAATGNKFTGTGLFRGILAGDVLQTKGPDSNNNGTVTVTSATDDEIVVTGITLTNQASHTRTFEGTVVRYYSTDGFVTTPADTPASVWYDPRVEIALQFTRSMYEGSRIGGQSIPGFGQITINNLDGGMDAYRSWGWSGRRITVEMGGEGFARNEYGVIFDGLTSGIELTDEFFTIDVKDLQALLDQDIWVPTYLGTGGTEGPVDLLGQYKPLTVGKVRNIEPIPLGVVNGRFTYQYNDATVNTFTPGLNLNFVEPNPVLDPRITFTRASIATIFNSSGILETVGNNVPRFDHDPITREPRGLLIEESRTNLLLRSEGFDNTSWSKVRSSITPDAVAAPDGYTTADKLVENSAAANTHDVRQSVPKAASSITYTASVFVRLAERTRCFMWLHGASQSNRAEAWFDISTKSAGTVRTQGAGFNSPASGVQDVGGGWLRVWLTATSNTDTTLGLLFGTAVVDGNSQTNGDGISGLYVWGAQLEVGPFPTSYIPTTSATVTRAADVATMETSSFAFNSAAGTWSICSAPLIVTSVLPCLTVDDGTTSERYRIINDTGTWKVQIVDGGVTQTDISLGVAAANIAANIAYSYAANDIAAVINSGTVSTDTLATLPAVTTVTIGTGRHQRISYTPSRIPNTDLQTLTASFTQPSINAAYDQGVPLIQSATAPTPAGTNPTNLSSAEYTYDGISGLVIVGGSEPALLTLDTFQYKTTTDYSVPQIMEYLVKERLRLDSTNSTSSVLIGLGSKSFVISDTFPTAVNGKILISLRDDPDNVWMYGTVTAWSGGTVTVNVTRTAGAGTYSDWVVTKIGLLDSEIVPNTFNDLHILNSSVAGIYIPSGGNALEILDQLAQSIGAYYGFNREGKFEVGRLESPTGTPDLVLSGEEVLELSRDNTRAPTWRIQLGYNKNWRPMTSSDIAGSVRANVVTNGTFDTATGWTFGTGWSFASFSANAVAGSASDLSRSINLVQGQTYTLRVEVTRSAGTLQPKLDTTNLGSVISASGIYEVDFTATATTGTLIFSKDSSFAGSIDNVTIVAKRLKFLSNEYRVVTESDTAIRSVYGPNSTSERIDTLLDVESQAQAECTRQLTLFSTFRDVFRIEAKTQAFSVDINSLVQLTDYRWGLEDGKLFRVLEISEDTSDNRVSLTLWG